MEGGGRFVLDAIDSYSRWERKSILDVGAEYATLFRLSSLGTGTSHRTYHADGVVQNVL